MLFAAYASSPAVTSSLSIEKDDEAYSKMPYRYYQKPAEALAHIIAAMIVNNRPKPMRCSPARRARRRSAKNARNSLEADDGRPVYF